MLKHLLKDGSFMRIFTMFFTTIDGHSYPTSRVRSMHYVHGSLGNGTMLYKVELDTDPNECVINDLEPLLVDDKTRQKIEASGNHPPVRVLATDGQFELITPHSNPEMGSSTVPIIGWKVVGGSVTPIIATGGAVGDDFSIKGVRNGAIWMNGCSRAFTEAEWLDQIRIREEIAANIAATDECV